MSITNEAANFKNNITLQIDILLQQCQNAVNAEAWWNTIHGQDYKIKAHNDLLQLGPKSCEILIFVCLHKDVKQCCDATKVDCTIEHCFITALFGMFLETNIKISPDLGIPCITCIYNKRVGFVRQFS